MHTFQPMMLTTCHALYALAVLATSGSPWPPAAALTGGADSAARVMILEELRGYYRDLHDRNWTSIVTHFYPAKVTARFAVPDDNREWLALAIPPLTPHERADAHGYCLPNAAIAIVGHWARVRARRCSGETDEAWFYSMSGHWKIIHLVSGASLTISDATRNSRRPTSRAVPTHVSFAACLESFRSTIATISSPSTGERP
jgi:hypothetical protein